MTKMQYGEIPGIDKPISRIVQGTMMLTDRDDIEPQFALLDAAFEAGINTFDTAHGYGGGGCERVFGRWLRERDIRDEVVIIGKGAHHNRDRKRVTPWDITADIHDSLARLGTDHIDLYILHRDDPTFPVSAIIDSLNEHVSDGNITMFGGSNWTHTRIQEGKTYARLTRQLGFICSSPHYSLATQHEEPWDDCVSISGEQGQAARDYYQANQMPLFTWSSLARGFLTGRYTRDNHVELGNDVVSRCYCHEDNFQRLDRAIELGREKDLSPAQIATAYVFSQPLNIYALIASFNDDELTANVQALDHSLSEAECAWLDLRSDDR